MRGLTIARRLGAHEFLFVANDDAPKILEPEFRVHRIPNLGTVFRNYQVDVGATVRKAIPLLWHRQRYVDEVLRLIDQFKPDVCMTDLEYFVPRAAEKAGLHCLTLDHQHVITCCRHGWLPPRMWWDHLLQGITPRYLFRPTAQNLLVSFYAPPVQPRYHARVVPPILRESVLRLNPRDDGHVVVYQSNSTHRKLVDFLLQATDRPCYVFGYDRTEGREGNVIFMKKSEEGFLKLLEGCSYVIQGGGHTLMTEALHLGKPILSLPLKAMVEQCFNALYLERLNAGRHDDPGARLAAPLRGTPARVPGLHRARAFLRQRSGLRPGGYLHPHRYPAGLGHAEGGGVGEKLPSRQGFHPCFHDGKTPLPSHAGEAFLRGALHAQGALCHSPCPYVRSAIPTGGILPSPASPSARSRLIPMHAGNALRRDARDNKLSAGRLHTAEQDHACCKPCATSIKKGKELSRKAAPSLPTIPPGRAAGIH